MIDEPTAALTKRVLDLESALARQTRIMACLLVCIVMIGSLAAFHPSWAAAAQPSSAYGPRTDAVLGTLRVRNVIVLDSNGTERVWIGAPLPEPRLLGKRTKRGDPVSGILLFDAEGNERGGYVTGDHSRGASLTLDEAGRAAIHLSAGDRGDVHLAFNDISQNAIRIGINPLGPYVSATSHGQTRSLVPADSQSGTVSKP